MAIAVPDRPSSHAVRNTNATRPLTPKRSQPTATGASHPQACYKQIYDYADVYHCENIDKVSDELIEKHSISEGQFDNIAEARYAIPSHWDIGKVYQRLILDVAHATGSDVIETLIVVYNSWITRKIDNYNSSMYYENPSYLFESYKAGTVLA